METFEESASYALATSSTSAADTSTGTCGSTVPLYTARRAARMTMPTWSSPDPGMGWQRGSQWRCRGSRASGTVDAP